mmetsp:Transcript_22372/g.36113  ORF Transcript_22372/g.36113 Transcript_22372/m.36113 type:complete len:128 (+) Transcript_22372:45-428(+)
MLCCDTIGNILRLAIIVGCIAALIFQYLSISSCNFLELESPVGTEGLSFSRTSIGIFFVGTDSECSKEPYDVTEDSFARGARYTSILSVLCGMIALGMISFEWVCCKICCAGCLEGLMLSAAWILGW